MVTPLSARQWASPHHESLITEVKCQRAAINPSRLQRGRFPLSPFTLSLRECMHLPSFLPSAPSLVFHLSTSITYKSCPTWQLPKGRNMCRRSTVIHFVPDSPPESLLRSHAIQTEWGKLSTPPPPTPPPHPPPFRWHFLFSRKKPNIRISRLRAWILLHLSLPWLSGDAVW